MNPIQINISLKPHNTFHLDVTAHYFTTVSSVDEVQQLFASDFFKQHRHLFMGGGSNILFTRNFNGLVIKNEIKGIETIAETDDTITLKVGAGESWHAFVMYCVDKNYGGVENLSLIPGTVGAAPMQNIGAYGVEVKEVIEKVEAIEIKTGNVTVFSNEACEFGYRESIFKEKIRDQYFISSVTLRLTKKNHQFKVSYGAILETLQQNGHDETVLSIKKISDAVVAIRRSKLPDPDVIGNAGSFFKNPSIAAALYNQIKKKYPEIPGFPSENGLIKIPAAWLIEQCDWKGKTFDSIGVHARQALVLVNYNHGDGEKIWQLAMQIQASVNEKFNVTLQPEVNVI